LNNVCTNRTKWRIHLRFFLFNKQLKLGHREKVRHTLKGAALWCVTSRNDN